MATDLKLNRNGSLILCAIGLVVMLFILYRVHWSRETVRISKVLSASIILAERGGRRIVEIRKMTDDEIGRLSKGRTNEGKDEFVTLGDKVCYHSIILFLSMIQAIIAGVA